MLSPRIRRKTRDLDKGSDLFEASEFGKIIIVYHIHLIRPSDDYDALDYIVLYLRYKYTDLFAAFTDIDRSIISITNSLNKFVRRRVYSKFKNRMSDVGYR